MARTTSGAVQGVLLDDYGPRRDGTNPVLTPFIEAASAIVDDVAVCAAAKDKTLTSVRLELIERWLAAHMFKTAPDQAIASKETGRSRAEFQGQTGLYLEGTKYGQMAVRLDSSGCLQAIAGAQVKKAGGFWMGLRPSEQTDYEDRD